MRDYQDANPGDFRVSTTTPGEWNMLSLLSGDRQTPEGDRTTGSGRALSQAELRSLIEQNTVRVETGTALGTGPVVRTESGQKVILTDDHVLGNKAIGSEVTVRLNGRPYRTQVIGKDPANDIAILALPRELQSLTGIEMAPSGRNQQGQRIITAGFPGGSDNLVITEGRAGGERRAGSAGVIDAPAFQDPNRPLVEADLHTRRGNSGGAVLDDRGRLIGLVHAGNGDMVVRRTDLQGRTLDVGRGNHTLITPVDLVRRTLGGSGREFRPVDLPSNPRAEQATLPDLAQFFRNCRDGQRGGSTDVPALRELITALLRSEGLLRFDSPYPGARQSPVAQQQPVRIVIRISRSV